MKDMGWVRVAEVRVVLGFCEHGNEHENFACRLPDLGFCSGRGIDEVSGRQCYQAELGGTNYPRCLRPSHTFCSVSRVGLDIIDGERNRHTCFCLFILCSPFQFRTLSLSHMTFVVTLFSLQLGPGSYN